MMISRVRGTEDILDLKLQTFFMQTTQHHMQCYNFTEIQTPILEHTNLFVRSLGTDTDVVSKEMYVFKAESEDSICLRPEGTASTIRAYIENGVQQRPWKVYTHGPMFRHERPQKGRWRQFSQFSIEVVNSPSIMHDIQFLKMLDDLFTHKLKIENYVLKLNFLGCSDDRKNHKAALLAFLETIADQICSTCTTRKDRNTLRIFDCKSETCQKLYIKAPKLIDQLCTPCNGEWKLLQETLTILSVNFIIDPLLVRGLDYYNKTAFEFSSRDLGAQNTFCGGGRYSLGKEVGANDDLASIGCAIGIGRTLMLMEQSAQKLALPEQPALHAIIPVAQEQQPLALLLGQELVNHDLCTEVLLEGSSVTNMLKKANKLGARYVLMLGSDEQAQGTVTVKDMLKGATQVVKQAEIIKILKN
ncbi:histidine--tRNA ligase [Candidatus Dependentiae bacterium]|nr:histidine--tRNA ligase [Candidatus Dependentiae bacterium]